MRATLRTSLRVGCKLLNSALADSVASKTSSDLYLKPNKWKGLKPEKIFQLYSERIFRLGTSYKPCHEELEALLSTSEHTGSSPSAIKAVYYGGEQAANEILSKNESADDFRPKPFMFDELPSQAQTLVQQHREQRFYNRLTAYELPLLAQYRQDYRRPSNKTHPVTYRYTSYIGESHSNSRKVVMSVKTADLGLNAVQLHKLRLLAKTRYDAISDVLKISSDQYPEPFQNARYLSGRLSKLIEEARNLEGDFSNVPLDTRHIAAKNLRRKGHSHIFPEEWKRPEDAPKEFVNVVDVIKNSL
ncbi:LAMI_0H18206g1_1 [Lachancea mirantina]|uniref:Small ribosomal subunit protein mS35 n=1 Tax=Lachancea mirantina TaxID=1230905 RepID=A0A1G4KJH0_9SACH|nr:LAMI_0H18206g1_1 [Lachancea mirantina]